MIFNKGIYEHHKHVTNFVLLVHCHLFLNDPRISEEKSKARINICMHGAWNMIMLFTA